MSADGRRQPCHERARGLKGIAVLGTHPQWQLHGSTVLEDPKSQGRERRRSRRRILYRDREAGGDRHRTESLKLLCHVVELTAS